jgi:uncharacterized protein YjiS (DUF1127 family)
MIGEADAEPRPERLLSDLLEAHVRLYHEVERAELPAMMAPWRAVVGTPGPCRDRISACLGASLCRRRNFLSTRHSKTKEQKSLGHPDLGQRRKPIPMTSMTHSGQTSIWQRLSDQHAHWTERRAQDRAYRSTVAQLRALSDRDLLDMGIHPADIDSIAKEAAYGA